MVIEKAINKLKEYWDYYKWPGGAASSGTCVSGLGSRWTRKLFKTYRLKALKSNGWKFGEIYYETLTVQFKKQQLIGKIIKVYGKDFRIVS